MNGPCLRTLAATTLVLAQLAAIACRPSESSATAERTRADIVKGLYEAFAAGDVPTVLAAMDSAIEWREADNFLYADRNPYVGPEAVSEGIFERIVADVDSFAAVPHNFIDGGNTVVVEGRYKGKIKATGKPVDAQFVHVWEVRDGKLVRFQQYTDTKQWADARGR